MATSGIVEYVSDSDEVLTASNYNELDALVFAQLSYFRFEDMHVKASDSYSVSEYANMVLNNQRNLSDDERQFLTELQQCERYHNCIIKNMQAENEESQWAAITIDFNDGSNSSAISMRGTDASHRGWYEDFEMLYDEDGTRAQELSRDYLNDCDSEHIYLTGHSKGGNDCTSAYIMSDKKVRDRVEHIHNFDGPGVNDRFRDDHYEAYRELDGKVDNYYPKDSIIGHLLNNNPGNNHYVDAEVRPRYADKGILGEHDPFAFGIDKKEFKPADQSDISKYLDEVLDKSIDDLSYEERRNLIIFLDKYGIINMISGGNTPFSYTEEEVKKSLEKLDILNILPDQIKDGLTKTEVLIVNIFLAVDIYINMSPEERDAALNCIEALIIHAAEKTKVFQEIVRIKDRIVNKYEEFANWLSDKYKKAKETILDINRGIQNKINELQEKWNELERYFKEKTTHFFSGIGGSGSGIFTINPPRMYQIQEQIITISKELEDYENELDSILSSLPAIGLPVVLIKKIKDGADNFFSVSLQSKCNKYGKSLQEIIRLYERTEKRITNG